METHSERERERRKDIKVKKCQPSTWFVCSFGATMHIWCSNKVITSLPICTLSIECNNFVITLCPFTVSHFTDYCGIKLIWLNSHTAHSTTQYIPNKHSIDHFIRLIKLSLLFIYFYIYLDDCVCVHHAPIFDFGGQHFPFPFPIVIVSFSCQLDPNCPINWQISFTTRTHIMKPKMIIEITVTTFSSINQPNEIAK